jgi:hypothetical protein
LQLSNLPNSITSASPRKPLIPALDGFARLYWSCPWLINWMK